MQDSNQSIQQTDKNKGDQSAAEQQQKETLKKPSPENMSGAQNTQQENQADQQVTGQKPHVTNNDGAPVNASGQGSKDVNMESNRQDNNQWLGKGKDKNQANKEDMGGSNQRQDQQDQSKQGKDQSK